MCRKALLAVPEPDAFRKIRKSSKMNSVQEFVYAKSLPHIKLMIFLLRGVPLFREIAIRFVFNGKAA